MGNSILEEIFIHGCLIENNTVGENNEGININTGRYNKRLSFNPRKGEKIIFYKFDNCEELLGRFDITNNDNKIDFIGIYTNQSRKHIFLIELKGKNIREAINQLRSVIRKIKNNNNFRNSYNRLKTFIKAIIVHTESLDRENTKIEDIDVIFLRNPATDRNIRRKLEL